MPRSWQLQEAKARFSELVRSAQREGPQAISVRGTPAAVLLSQQDYEDLTGRKPSFLNFIRTSPLVGARLAITRDHSLARTVDL